MEQHPTFPCPEHPDEVIARIDPVKGSGKDLYCTECLFSDKTPEDLTNRLKKVDVFLKDVANHIQLSKPKQVETNQIPTELSTVLDGQSEAKAMISQKLETEKVEAEKLFDWISTHVQEIITLKRKQYITVIENQLTNLDFLYSSLDKQIRKVHPSLRDVESLYPTLDQLASRLNKLTTTNELATYVTSLKQDLNEMKSEKRQELLQESIKDLVSKIDTMIKNPPALKEFNEKAESKGLEKFISAYIGTSVQLQNAIEGPAATTLSTSGGSVGMTGSFVEIDPASCSVEVSSTVYGGGTGQEYPKNLLVPGNSGGNKWYTTDNGPHWIKVNLPSSKKIKMYGVKSGNDCEGRDPYSWKTYGMSASGTWECFHEVKEIRFDRRYDFRYFAVDNDSYYTEIKIEIDRNRALVDSGYWGDGTQLCEVSFFEAKC